MKGIYSIKTALILLFLLSNSILFSQEIFEIISPNARQQQSLIQSKRDQEINFYQVDVDQLKSQLNQQNEVSLTIPVGREIKNIVLQKVNILSPDYQLFTSSGKSYKTANQYVFYHGYVKGKDGSKATLIMYRNQISVSIYDEAGNYEIHKSDLGYFGSYDDEENEARQNWECAAVEIDDLKGDDHSITNRSSTVPECVTVFFEIDHNMYNKHGGNIANAEAWLMTLFTQISILYMEHDVPLNISGIQVWDTTDPYVSASNTQQALPLFRTTVQNNPNFNGRLAHLVSGRGLGGGIAYLNVLCSSFSNVAVSANMNANAVVYPNYSWNVMVVAHELGHNMGSPHTQACKWNGNNTAIDGCGSIEGSCSDPGNPPNNVGGTIMSYCHLTSSGINFNNGFGPQPGGLIQDKYNNASCTTGENCSFVSPFNDVCNRAKELPVHNYCIEAEFSNYATTPSGNGGNLSCGNGGVENDIWYKFDYANVSEINIDVQAIAGMSDLIVEVYQGPCNTLTSLDCSFSTNGSVVSIALTDNLLIGETIYVRIVEDGSDEEGEFAICIYSEELPCQEQLDTLINIYEELNGANWTIKTGWEEGFLGTACDYCNWHGIQCDYYGNITSMDLSYNNLQGMLMEEFTAFTEITNLNLSNNALMDTIPNYWDSLDKLYLLDLRNNQFTGTVPASYGTMTEINTIYLDYNLLDSLPTGLGYNSSLRTFTASNNLLEGCFVQGISSFCYKDSLNLSNNVGLPYGGDVTLLCENGWGSDWDNDGFCSEIEDCNDYDAEINPAADEVLCDGLDNDCDGEFDEGSDFGPNVWIGPDTLGVFSDSANWSLEHVPLICENVEIGTSGEAIDLIIHGNNAGEGNGGIGKSLVDFGNLHIRGLTIGENATVYLGDTTNLTIKGTGVLVNHGTMNIYGYISILNQKETTNTAFLNNGNFSLIEYGGLNLQEIGQYGIHNTSTGVMSIDGYLNFSLYNQMAPNGLLNEGSFTLFKNFYINGEFTNQAILNANGGSFISKDGSGLYINE